MAPNQCRRRTVDSHSPLAPPETRGRRVAPDRTRFAGKHLGVTAIRVSAGSFWSLTNLRRNSCRDAVGWSDPIVRILSVRIVRLLGVSRFRPPRRSPGLEPLSMFHPPGPRPGPQPKPLSLSPRRERLCPGAASMPQQHPDARRSLATRSTRCRVSVPGFIRGQKAAGRNQAGAADALVIRLGRPARLDPSRSPTVESALQSTHFQPLDFTANSTSRSIANNTLLPLLPIHNSIATRPHH